MTEETMPSCSNESPGEARPAGPRASPPPAPLRLPVHWRRFALSVLLCCVWIETALVVLDYHLNYGRLVGNRSVRAIFDVSREHGLASWFATTQTFLLALTAWGLWYLARRRASGRGERIGWLVVALFFTYVSIDDGAFVHERLGSAFGDFWEHPAVPETAWGARLVRSFPSYTWHLALAPALGALTLFSAVFLARCTDRAAHRWIVAGALACLALAVGLDFAEGLEPDHAMNPYTHLTERYDMMEYTLERFRAKPYATLLHFSKSVEEFLEMLAVSLLWFVALRYGGRVAPDVRLVSVDAEARAPGRPGSVVSFGRKTG